MEWQIICDTYFNEEKGRTISYSLSVLLAKIAWLGKKKERKKERNWMNQPWWQCHQTNHLFKQEKSMFNLFMHMTATLCHNIIQYFFGFASALRHHKKRTKTWVWVLVVRLYISLVSFSCKKLSLISVFDDYYYYYFSAGVISVFASSAVKIPIISHKKRSQIKLLIDF